MTFFKNIYFSIWSPSFYKALPTKSLWFSIWYLVKLSFLLALVSIIFYIPNIYSFFSQETIDSFIEQYPSDLVVTIHNGKASINKPEPYLIPNTIGDKVKNLAVVDTQSDFSAKQFTDYSTHVLLKKDSLIITDDNGLRLVPLTEVKDFTLSHDVLVGWGSKFSPYLTLIASVAAFLFFLFIGLASTGIVIYLLLAALVVLFFSYLFKWHLTYKDSYKAALHAATLPILISVALPFVHLQPPIFSFTLLLLLVLVFNLWSRPTNGFTSESPRLS